MVYSLFLTFIGYRTMTWDKLMKAAAKAAKTTGVVLLLIGVSTMFQYIMTILEIPDKTAALLLSATTDPLIMFFLIVEPHGLARLWQIGKEKLRLWPFPH